MQGHFVHSLLEIRGGDEECGGEMKELKTKVGVRKGVKRSEKVKERETARKSPS